MNGLAHIPMPAGPTRQTGKPTRGRELAREGMGASPNGVLGLRNVPGRVMVSVALSRTFIHIGHAFDLLKSMWGTGQSGETDVK